MSSSLELLTTTSFTIQTTPVRNVKTPVGNGYFQTVRKLDDKLMIQLANTLLLDTNLISMVLPFQIVQDEITISILHKKSKKPQDSDRYVFKLENSTRLRCYLESAIAPRKRIAKPKKEK
mgnify:CR=1 FL=1